MIKILATLTVTPIANINYQTMSVVDRDQVFMKDYDWDENVEVYDVLRDEIVSSRLSGISLYDDRIVINGIQHHVLHMLSR